MTNKERMTVYLDPSLKEWVEETAHQQSLRLKRFISISELVGTILNVYREEKEKSHVDDNREQGPPSSNRGESTGR